MITGKIILTHLFLPLFWRRGKASNCERSSSLLSLSCWFSEVTRSSRSSNLRYSSSLGLIDSYSATFGENQSLFFVLSLPEGSPFKVYIHIQDWISNFDIKEKCFPNNPKLFLISLVISHDYFYPFLPYYEALAFQQPTSPFETSASLLLAPFHSSLSSQFLNVLHPVRKDKTQNLLDKGIFSFKILNRYRYYVKKIYVYPPK